MVFLQKRQFLHSIPTAPPFSVVIPLVTLQWPTVCVAHHRSVSLALVVALPAVEEMSRRWCRGWPLRPLLWQNSDLSSPLRWARRKNFSMKVGGGAKHGGDKMEPRGGVDWPKAFWGEKLQSLVVLFENRLVTLAVLVIFGPFQGCINFSFHLIFGWHLNLYKGCEPVLWCVSRGVLKNQQNGNMARCWNERCTKSASFLCVRCFLYLQLKLQQQQQHHQEVEEFHLTSSFLFSKEFSTTIFPSPPTLATTTLRV